MEMFDHILDRRDRCYLIFRRTIARAAERGNMRRLRTTLGSVAGLIALCVAVVVLPGQSTGAAQSQSVFAFGGAVYFGSSGVQPLNQLMVGMAGTTSGNGYWVVAADGGIFTDCSRYDDERQH